MILSGYIQFFARFGENTISYVLVTVQIGKVFQVGWGRGELWVLNPRLCEVGFGKWATSQVHFAYSSFTSFLLESVMVCKEVGYR